MLKFIYRYIPTDEGRYIHIPNPYIHMDNPYLHQYDPYIEQESKDIYKFVLTPPENDLPYYKNGYYRNNGIKIINQKHNYDEDKYDFT